MSETIRCPACGGLNPSAAQWCGQCLTRFDVSSPPPPPPAPPSPTDVVTSEGRTVARSAVGTRHGAFLVTEEGVRWRCARCETENPLELQSCAVCGSSFAATVEPPPERPARDPNAVAMYSLFWPGAGHAYLGMWGQAVARGVLSAWVVAVTLIAGIQGSTPGSTLMTVLFGVAAFGLWILGAHDAYREAQNDPGSVILKGRLFVYVVLGLLVLLMVLVVSAGMQVRSA